MTWGQIEMLTTIDRLIVFLNIYIIDFLTRGTYFIQLIKANIRERRQYRRTGLDETKDRIITLKHIIQREIRE